MHVETIMLFSLSIGLFCVLSYAPAVFCVFPIILNVSKDKYGSILTNVLLKDGM